MSDRHVLQIGESDDDGSGAGGILNPGMVGRLLEDCPDGWSDALSLESASFMVRLSTILPHCIVFLSPLF